MNYEIIMAMNALSLTALLLRRIFPRTLSLLSNSVKPDKQLSANNKQGSKAPFEVSKRKLLMQPKDVMSMLLVGKDLEYDLFKTAIFFAETGINVWFIAPVKFTKIPKEIKHPGKEVLQQITFMYLKDHADLIKQLNGIHLWHKQPSAIIVSNFGYYCNFLSASDNSLAAFVSTNLIDSIATCANKKREKVFLLLACDGNVESNRLCLLRDLYFPNVMHKKEDSSCFDEVTEFFKQF